MYGPRFVYGGVGLERLVATTDSEGRFLFDDIHPDATADFLVSAAGYATVFTGRGRAFSPRHQFDPGKTDIKVTLPPEAVIEGTVVDRATEQPLADIALAIAPKGEKVPAVGCRSGVDGSFRVAALDAGEYEVTLAPAGDGQDERVAAPVPVSVVSGQTASGVRVELASPGVLEVTVNDAAGSPIERAFVELSFEDSRETAKKATNEKGVARFAFAPGGWTVRTVYADGYSPIRPLEYAYLTEGRTVALVYELTKLSVISGVVLDDAGAPAEFVEIRIQPLGVWEVAGRGSGGKFCIEWNPEVFGGASPELYLIATLPERNLGAVVELTNPDEPIEVKLLPAVTVAGRIVDKSGAAVPFASVDVLLSRGFWAWSVGDASNFADDQGRFEVAAVPRGMAYQMKIASEGYGRKTVGLDLERPQSDKLQLADIVLDKADETLRGTVAEADGAAVPNADVTVMGEGGVSKKVKTDSEGAFSVDALTPGSVRVVASLAARNLYSETEVEVPASGVKIIVASRGPVESSETASAAGPPSIIGSPLADLGFLEELLSKASADGKLVLVLIWDVDQRPSRHYARTLAGRADELAAKSVVIVSADASSAGEDARAQMLSDLGIKYPVVLIRGDSQQTLSRFGMTSLPFLILTDSAHTIRAAGFSLDELNAKIDSLDADDR